MENSGLACRERRELEKRIHACVRSMTYSSAPAAKLARGSQQSKWLDFQVLQADYATERARLETLLECLALHQRLHRCDAELTTSYLRGASDSYNAPSRQSGESDGSIASRDNLDGAGAGYSRSRIDHRANEEADRAIETEDRGDGQTNYGSLLCALKSANKAKED